MRIYNINHIEERKMDLHLINTIGVNDKRNKRLLEIIEGKPLDEKIKILKAAKGFWS